VALAIGFTTGQHCLDYYRLSRHGAPIEGTVVGPYPHGQTEYSFVSGGKTYVGVGFLEASFKPLGDKIRVIYLPESPTVNCLGNPHDLYLKELPLVIAVVLLFPTLIVIAVARRFATRAREHIT
jgi:hypothetical protein